MTRPVQLHATGRPGWLLDAATPGLRPARKRETEVGVAFAPTAGGLQTLEGVVQVRPGDAIVTGSRGERWRVSAPHFAAKYRATDQPGRYLSRPYEVRALRLEHPCEVLLTDAVSVLHGRAGDWLLDYGDGSLGIVASDLFDLTYELL